jgi:hypothetical protein
MLEHEASAADVQVFKAVYGDMLRNGWKVVNVAEAFGSWEYANAARDNSTMIQGESIVQTLAPGDLKAYGAAESGMQSAHEAGSTLASSSTSAASTSSASTSGSQPSATGSASASSNNSGSGTRSVSAGGSATSGAVAAASSGSTSGATTHAASWYVGALAVVFAGSAAF